MDHSWIRPGVKAVMVNGITHPELDGTTVTIKAVPEIIQWVGHLATEPSLGVLLEESDDLVRGITLYPKPHQLIPYHEPPDWEAMSTKKELENV